MSGVKDSALSTGKAIKKNSQRNWNAHNTQKPFQTGAKDGPNSGPEMQYDQQSTKGRILTPNIQFPRSETLEKAGGSDESEEPCYDPMAI